MRSSRSWRLTAPLRFALRLIRGDTKMGRILARAFVERVFGKIPRHLRRLTNRQMSRNCQAVAALVDARCALTREPLLGDPLTPQKSNPLPPLDITVVTHNSRRWIDGFVDSIVSLEYPRELLTLHFVDNASTDTTFEDLQSACQRLKAEGINAKAFSCPNRGFGAGHNTAMRSGHAPFCLVTNIDLTFEKSSLARVARIAIADDEWVAAWELRQKPYEHPKFYDPITGLTNWNSHACVLLRRSALAGVGGYDETIFMYGEDVELSYRLRRAGFMLRYCPKAAVHHFSYEHPDQVKPLQYIGGTFAHLYLRLKYGTFLDIAAVLPLALRLALAPEVFVGSRRKVVRSLLRLLAVSPHALAGRQKSRAIFPFRAWDYELTREGGFVRYTDSRSSEPLVSVITRTYRGREVFLKQALLSVAHQTYPNVEHIVVEDGGDTMRAAINNVEQATGSLVRFIGLEKCGRAVAANAGLAAARGRWCLFLDDDDLLFADHLDVLTSALLAEPSAVAAYSLAWEVATDKAKSADGTYRELTHRVPSVLRQPFDSDVLMHHNFMPIQSVLFKRELFETRGGVDEDMDVLEDWLLWLRYARGNHFVYVPKVTSIYRVPADPQETRKREDTFGAAYPLARARAHGALFNRERRRVAYASGEVFTGCVQSSEEDTPAGTMAER